MKKKKIVFAAAGFFGVVLVLGTTFFASTCWLMTGIPKPVAVLLAKSVFDNNYDPDIWKDLAVTLGGTNNRSDWLQQFDNVWIKGCQPGYRGSFGMYWAILSDDPGRVRHVIDQGLSPNHIDDNEFTPLGWAVGLAHHQAAKALLAAGADPNFRGNKNDKRDRNDPLNDAAMNGDKEMVAILLAAGATPKGMNGMSSPLSAAIIGGHDRITMVLGQPFFPETQPIDIVRLLLAAGADPNDGGWSGLPPLFFLGTRLSDPANNAHDLELLKILLKAGANPLLPFGKSGRSALESATSRMAEDQKLQTGDGTSAEYFRLLTEAAKNPDFR